MQYPLIQRLRQFRAIEFQLLVTVLLFFAAGYLLAVFATRQSEFVTSVPEVLNILWPSTMPLLLFVAVSLGLSWRTRDADQILLPLVALLSGLGLLLNARLKPGLDRILCLTRDGTFVPCYGDVAAKQTLWVTLGVIVLAAMLFIPWDHIFIRLQRSSLMDWLNHYPYVWLTLGIGLMIATFFFGTDPNQSGVRVWFDLGFFLFQPVELLKIILVIFMASYMDRHREVVVVPYRLGPVPLPPLPYLVPLIGMWGVAMGVIIFQRDLGAALLLFGVFLAMLYVATGRGMYVVAGLTAFGIGTVSIHHLATSLDLYQYINIVQVRLAIWLDPWSVAQGAGYQIVQAMYALSAGGVFGVGLGRGVPTVVPAIHTDFAFTAIGEELGLMGTIGVLITYLLLIFRGFHIGLLVPGRFRGFEQLLAIGLTSILAIQTFIIIGGNLRLIPLTGITLPFISYGGSSVLTNFLIIGLLMRISDTSHKAGR